MSKTMNLDGSERGSKQALLTRERLLELLSYDPGTGVWTWKVDRTGTARAGSVAGNIDKPTGYRIITIDGARHTSARLAVLYMTGAFPTGDADHKDRIRHNDKWYNLRGINRQGNNRNRSMQSNNKSRITGVFFNKQRQKWQACIKTSGKNIYFGLYKEFHNAVMARYCGELQHDWSASDPNTPAKRYVDKYLGRNSSARTGVIE